MRRTPLVAGLAAIAGAVPGVTAAQRAPSAREVAVNRNPLARTDVSAIERAKAPMVSAEIPPGARAGKHHHPGPELVSVLEGSGILEIEGRPPQTVKGGGHLTLEAGEVHDLKNANRADSLRVLAFLIAEKGQPLAVVREGPMAQQPTPAGGASGAMTTRLPGAPGGTASSSGVPPTASPQ